ncbi:hypothetical protein [Pseudomonas sp. GL-RE-29]|jgi:hypothetical protein|uniref:hypothetical protein n=1 Tax=Pseudomonas sp. GL-RE-29 TaxID=2832375 RepID=UPI001CC0EDCC|nr:hypothetical protein [Pseudomonas sp. GL-RE-29]
MMARLWNKRKLANDQKIAAFGSSYIGARTPVGAAEGGDLLIFKNKKAPSQGQGFYLQLAA